MASAQFKVLHCALPGVSAVEAASRRAFAAHTHEEFGIGVICAGAQRSLSGRGPVEAGAGDVITVNPGEIHDGAPIGEGRRWRMLYLSPEVVAHAAADIAEGRRHAQEFSRPVIADRRTARRVLQLFATLTSGEDEGHAEALLLAVLAGALGEAAARPPGPAAIERARRRIDEDPAAALTLQDLASECGLSRFQVLRGFAAATGFTPHAYLVQRRVDLARRLISQGVRLSEAAAASGFADQSHMTRAFTARYGLTPGAYAAAA